MVTQEQLKNLSERVSKLKGYLEIDKKLIEISNEEEKTSDPSFWNNPKEAEVLMKSLRFKKKWPSSLALCTRDRNSTHELLHSFHQEYRPE